MNTESLAALAAFINGFPFAWEAFKYELETRAMAPIFTAFAFEQNAGSYVLTDDGGAVVKFRLYNGSIVAISSAPFSLVLVNKDAGYILL